MVPTPVVPRRVAVCIYERDETEGGGGVHQPRVPCVVPLMPCVVPQVPCVLPLVPCVLPLVPCVVPLVPCVVPLALVPLRGAGQSCTTGGGAGPG